MKKNMIILTAIAVLILSSCCGCFGSSKLSLKDGEFLIVPEVKMGMTFNEIPDKWIPFYEYYVDDNLIEHIYLHLSSFDSTETKVVEYEGINFNTYLVFDLSRPAIRKDEMDSKPLVRKIVCAARNVTVEQKDKIFKNLVSCYGDPLEIIYEEPYWEDGDYCISISYVDEKLIIEISDFLSPLFQR